MESTNGWYPIGNLQVGTLIYSIIDTHAHTRTYHYSRPHTTKPLFSDHLLSLSPVFSLSTQLTLPHTPLPQQLGFLLLCSPNLHFSLL